jgi:hypothetical protein
MSFLPSGLNATLRTESLSGSRLFCRRNDVNDPQLDFPPELFKNRAVCSRPAGSPALVLAEARKPLARGSYQSRNMEHLSKKLSDILAQLGDSADEIAMALKAHEIQGVRNTVRFLNPIVRYVQQALSIGLFNVDLTEPETLRVALDDTNIRTGLRQPIKDFLRAFDEGAYPELEMQDVAGHLQPAVS